MAPDVPQFRQDQEVYHKTDDVPGIVLALVYYTDCLRYKVVWQGRTVEEHSAGELTTERPLFTTSSKGDDD